MRWLRNESAREVRPLDSGPNISVIAPTGSAYKTMIGWLGGSVPDGCGSITSGSYFGLADCYITRPGGAVDEIVFDFDGNLTMRAPTKGSYTEATLSGRQIRLKSGALLGVGASPILISPVS